MNTAAATGPSSTATLPWPRASYAWYVVAVLVLAFSFAILDRTIISLLVAPIRRDLQITDAQIGLLQGLAFAICYTTFGLLLGFLTDRLDRRAVLTGGIAFWSVATIACGLANSFETLFLARVGVGLGEAAIMPVAASLIADYFPAQRRGHAFGIFLFGGSIGVGLGNLVGGITVQMSDQFRAFWPSVLGGFHDWQIAFFAVGAPGILIAALFLATVREPVRREKVRPTTSFSLKPLFSHMGASWTAYLVIMGGAVINTTSIYANSSWLATVFIRVHHWTPQQVGSSLAVMSLIGMTSSVSIGWVLAWFSKKGRTDGPIWTSFMQSLFQGVWGPMVGLAPTPELALAFYSVMLLCTNWTTSSTMTALSQITPNELRGQVVAFQTLLTGVVSLTASGFAVGFLSDRVFIEPTGIGSSLALVLFVCGASGVTILMIGRKAFQAAAVKAATWQEKG